MTAVLAGMTATSPSSVLAQDASPVASPAATAEPTLTAVAFSDPEFDGQFIRALDTIPYRGADIGEAFITARRIPDGDRDAWYREWYALGERSEALAHEALAAGNTVSARDAFLRACTYYRTASVFLFITPLQEGLVTSFASQRRAFEQAMVLFDRPGEAVDIPYEDTTLPGYLLLPAAGDGPFPLLIITGGYDGTREESYLAGGAAALEQGYACLIFDGPGQGQVLVDQQLYFRPDWEAVVTPVVDYVLERPEIDPDRIALMGRSWGGYLAPRAATAEHRLGAVIADAAQYSPGSRVNYLFPPEQRALFEAGTDHDDELNAWLEAQMAEDEMLAFAMERGMLTHGEPTPIAYLRSYPPYTLVGIAEQIQCPALILEGEADSRGGDAMPLYDAITAPKEYILFANADGAGLHDEEGAANLFALKVFNWLNATFGL